MKLANTTEVFNYFLPDYESRIRASHEAGFKYIDISFYDLKLAAVFLQSDWERQVERLQEVAGELGIKYVQSHLPSADGRETEPEAIALVNRCIEVSGMLGIKNAVLHSAFAFADKENNKKYYSNFFDAMEKWDVNVLVENSGASGEDGRLLKELIEYVNHPNFHACWDIGHAARTDGQRRGILALGEEIRAIHFNDNDGKGDLHDIPFTGILKVDEAMRALIEINYGGYFTFECSVFKTPTPYWIEKRSSGIENELTAPSAKLRVLECKLLYETGKYILEHYGLYEE